MVDDSQTKTAAHAVLAAVLQVRDGRLQALLWQRAREPYASCWALPGGALAADETLEESMRRHLAEKVDVREVSHLEQLETRSDPNRNPGCRELATGYLGLVPSGVDPKVPPDTRWHPVDELPELAYDHEEFLLMARERLRGKLSYTNLGFALAPPSFTLAELRDLYAVALGHQVSATNLQRVLLRRRLLEDTGERRHYGGGGGRPATIYRFRITELEITDPFAVLRPPTMAH
jgi:8-oxo-dGTP diphosphatase